MLSVCARQQLCTPTHAHPHTWGGKRSSHSTLRGTLLRMLAQEAKVVGSYLYSCTGKCRGSKGGRSENMCNAVHVRWFTPRRGGSIVVGSFPRTYAGANRGGQVERVCKHRASRASRQQKAFCRWGCFWGAEGEGLVGVREALRLRLELRYWHTGTAAAQALLHRHCSYLDTTAQTLQLPRHRTAAQALQLH